MFWSIIWDINGSIYEWNNIKSKDFNLFSENMFFTDDTSLTIATIDAVLNNESFWKKYNEYFRKYPWKWYWSWFTTWCFKNRWKSTILPWYNSLWNWSAMRVAPLWYVYNTLEETLENAKKSAECTHNHPEWIKWALCIAWSIFYLRNWKDKDFIKNYVEKNFNYDLNRKSVDIKTTYKFNEYCHLTVPEAIITFLESTSFEDSIKNAISLWWDSDTIACINWGLAEAYYWIPSDVIEKTKKYLPEDMLNLIYIFYKKYNINTIEKNNKLFL